MPNFMPASAPQAEELSAKLADTVFKTPDQFVELYNSGLINLKFPLVVELIDELTTAFKNVSHEGNKLVFISENEILLEETLAALAPWLIATKIKREVLALVDSKVIGVEDEIFFSNATGAAGLLYSQDEEGSPVEVGAEKHVRKHADIEPVYELFSSLKAQYSSASGEYFFQVSDFTTLDDSFIAQVHSLVPNV